MVSPIDGFISDRSVSLTRCHVLSLSSPRPELVPGAPAVEPLPPGCLRGDSHISLSPAPSSAFLEQLSLADSG